MLTNTQEYKLSKSTSIPYKNVGKNGNDLSWQEIKWKLEEVYTPIASEVHPVSDLHKNNDLMKLYKNAFKILLN